jgi:hypothetical protein
MGIIIFFREDTKKAVPFQRNRTAFAIYYRFLEIQTVS